MSWIRASTVKQNQYATHLGKGARIKRVGYDTVASAVNTPLTQLESASVNVVLATTEDQKADIKGIIVTPRRLTLAAKD
jgi:hypothetical protein